jgi:hypothetical protein
VAGLKATFVIAAGLACAAGCTLLVDLGGLAGDATTSDAGDETARPTGDATTEASAADGGADADAGADASTRFCPKVGAVVCQDFDDSDAALPGPWDGYVRDPDVTFEATSARARSAPRALVLQTDGTGRNANLESSFAGLKGAELAFDLYIETRGSNLTVAWFEVPGLGAIYLQPGDPAYTGITETHEESGSTVYENTAATPLPTGSWIHVVIDVDFPLRKATVTLDAVTTIRGLRAPWASVTAAEIHLGIPATSKTTLFYDNVTIKTR